MVPTEFKGSIDIVVFDPDDPRRQNVRLNQPGVLPLKPGDRFAVEAEISPPAYLYILWIDADGSVDPVYPWRRGHWDDLPPEEKPVETGAPAGVVGSAVRRHVRHQGIGAGHGDAGDAGAEDAAAARTWT